MIYQWDGVTGLVFFGALSTLGIWMAGNYPLSERISGMRPKLQGIEASSWKKTMQMPSNDI